MKKIIFLLLFLITGCYNYQDINKLAITKVISVNKINKQYELSIKVINSKDNIVYKVKGNTIDDIFINMEKICPKNITYDHIKIILINKRMVDNFDDLLNYLLLNKHINDDIYLLVSNKKITDIDDNNLLAILNKNNISTLSDILNDYLNNSKLNIPNIDKDIYE